MANCGDGRELFVTGVGKDRTFSQQEIQAGMVVASKAGQVVVAELVHDDGQHQLGASRTGGLGPSPEAGDAGEDECDEDAGPAGPTAFAHMVHDIRLGGDDSAAGEEA